MFAEDLSAFLADHGEEVTLNGMGVIAIFDDASTLVMDGVISTSTPTLNMPTATFEATGAVNGSDAIVDGVLYHVAGQPENDGTGWAIVRLEKQ